MMDGGFMGLYAASFVLGAAHAIEPGHGKTVVAAYLVGSKGRNIDAVFLGLVVTLTHSVSVILLALAGKIGAQYVDDKTLHVYLGFVSSLIILVVGAWMLYRRVFHVAHGHAHGQHGHGHKHGREHGHEHGHEHDAPVAGRKRAGLGQLAALGVSGGIVPCPSAFALLLAAISAGQMAKGLSLVIVFSLGLAAALVAIGLVVVNTAAFAGRYFDFDALGRRMAVVSAVLVTAIGAYALYSSIRHMI
ncbi:MAG: sulfite exporter TauE/SafE family protein [Nitrospirae bacterium]|nr:sulfite exporter TauE/SafE family protein [Nitrospirota bacterium]